ncbi:TPA: hypothetical protein O7X99_001785 [Salmonella enterica]|nr:hypothetical protein [Salmonella enterica]HDC0445801.1 hypothetical protein [Salmonella enterica]HDC0527436.1 hypothetical protein [Salmonella enterica]HDC1176514.1 hypothetical protein [Salmonella enterica]HDC1969713.1 hypothetical protein [Salmonella enterica]
MDESRKQFLEWFQEKYKCTADTMKVMQIKVELAWEAWQASRAVIEIKLDDKVMVEDEFDKGHNCAIDYCAEAIRAAGINVKE